MPKNNISFESAIQELEETISHLESDTLTLEQAVKYFERGVYLMRRCEAHLKNAEGRLRELLKGEDGTLVERILGSTAQQIIADGDAHE